LYHRGELVGDIPVKALTDGCPVYHPSMKVPAYYEANANVDTTRYPEVTDLEGALKRVLASPTVASKEWVYNQYDYMVRTDTYVRPGSDAAVVGVSGTRKALAMTTDCNGRYVYLDPEIGGKIAVAEAARNIVCSGAEPLAVTDNLNFGSPEKPEIFWQLSKAVDGMAEACRKLNTPVIGGNVSLYNENAKGAIYPTPVVGMVGMIEDVDHITTQHFKREGDIVFLLGETRAELGGSEFQKTIHGVTEGRPPRIDLDTEKALLDAVLAAIRDGLVASAHDLSEGGLAVALAESCIGGRIGAAVDIATDLRADFMLFSESQSRILLSASPDKAKLLERRMAQAGVPCFRIGTVGGADLCIAVNGKPAVRTPVAELENVWKEAIPCLMQ
jgi:phosphoribosylformylglycinamidine synthase